jgi:hypothetical protein
MTPPLVVFGRLDGGWLLTVGVAGTVTGLCGAGGIAGPAAEVTGGRDGADAGDAIWGQA